MRKITTTIRNWYRKFQSRGQSARFALRDARTMAMWEQLESIGLVRFQFVLEQEPYDDSYIDTWTDRSERERAHARKELWETIERDGVWMLVGEFRMLPYAHGEVSVPYVSPEQESGWEHGVSIGGLVGTGETGYETDIAYQTIEALRTALRSRCPRCRVCSA